MIQCSECGAQYEEDVKICETCGTVFQEARVLLHFLNIAEVMKKNKTYMRN